VSGSYFFEFTDNVMVDQSEFDWLSKIYLSSHWL